MPRPLDPDPALAAALRRLREARGLTQEHVAHEAGVTMGTLSKIETGAASPAWATVVAITTALDVSLSELAKAVEAERT
jgi:transcriptional regulator with XRE-family HTH domain